MVKSCSAYKCKNRFGKLGKDGKRVSFHKFPLTNIDLLKKWVEAMNKNKKDWKLTKQPYLCGDHFVEDDYATAKTEIFKRQRYLKPTAVPSVFKPSLSLTVRKYRQLPEQNLSPASNQLKSPDKATTLDHTTSQSSTLPALVETNTESESQDDELTPHVENQTSPEQNPSPAPDVRNNPASPDKLTPRKKNHTVPEQKTSSTSNQSKCSDVKATTLDLTSHQTLGARNSTALPDNGPGNQAKMLRKKVKVLQERLRRRDKKIAQLESMLLTAQKCCSKSSDTSQILKDTYGDIPCEILINMLSNKSKKPGAHRYSKPIMEFAATLYYNSPSIYDFLRSKLSLPHPSYIRSKDISASSEEETDPYVSPIIIPIKKE